MSRHVMKATRSTKSGPERLGRVGSSFFGRLFRADHGLYSGIAPSPIGTPVSRARAVFRAAAVTVGVVQDATRGKLQYMYMFAKSAKFRACDTNGWQVISAARQSSKHGL
jgi:hypothetical protein